MIYLHTLDTGMSITCENRRALSESSFPAAVVIIPDTYAVI